MTEDRSTRHRVVIIGAGPGGICAGIRLKQAGIDDFVILEQAAGVGGTWWHNRYPGAECDVKSHLYSYSFALNPDWPHPFSGQRDIQGYFEACVERFGLWPHIRLKTSVRSLEWQEETALWHADTEDGVVRGRVVISAMGMFNRLAWPEIPGRDQFAGSLFHSARWPQGLDLAGRTVGVIGSAASAVQLVPHVAQQADRLYLFQRTANWVLPKGNVPYTAEDLARFRDDPAAIQAVRTEVFDFLNALITGSNPDFPAQAEAAVREAIDQVRDPDVRQRLIPDHPFGCKRPLFSDNYYPVFNRPNVELVTERIARISDTGVVTQDGQERPADVLIMATGFQTTRFLSAIDVVGRDGISIHDAWDDGAQAYLGITTAGFPNLFMLYGPNTNTGSIIYAIEQQVGYILRQLERMDAEGIAWLDVRQEVMDQYNAALQQDIDAVAVWHAPCSTYYRAPSGRIVTQWPHTMDEFRRRTQAADPTAYEVSI